MEYIPLLRICLLIGGVLQILFFLRIVCQTERSKHWPTTTGIILSSELSSFGSENADSSKTYKADIKYQYQIDEKNYTSRRIYYGDWISISFSSLVKKIVREYGVGKECIVHYDPQNPLKEVLRVTLATPVYFLLLGGLTFVGISIYLFFI